MIKLYKNRDFGTFITDCFSFFKHYGGNYFKNFILINGVVLLLLILVAYFGFKEFLGQIFGGNLSGESYYFEQYFQENIALFIGVGILLLIIYSLLMMLNLLYPVFFIHRIANGQTSIKADEIISDFKTNSGKVLRLFLGLILLVIPVAMVISMISYLLIFVFIGLPILLFVVPTIFNAIIFLVYDYMYTNRGFFESLSYSIRTQFSYTNGREKSPYWKYWGSTTILFALYYIVTMIFSAIPMVLLITRLSIAPSTGNFEDNPFQNGIGTVIAVLYGVMIVVSAFLMNVLYINSALQYFDSRRDLHQQLEMEEIDTIGLDG